MLPLVIDNESKDCANRGASLDYSRTGERPWLPVSYHDNDQQAQEAFLHLASWMDSDPAHYRVACHRLDVVPEHTCAGMYDTSCEACHAI